jgi:hypothetical protein
MSHRDCSSVLVVYTNEKEASTAGEHIENKTVEQCTEGHWHIYLKNNEA